MRFADNTLRGEMKFIYALIMCAALAGLALSLFLGMAYHFEGKGLHPALAGIFGI